MGSKCEGSAQVSVRALVRFHESVAQSQGQLFQHHDPDLCLFEARLNVRAIHTVTCQKSFPLDLLTPLKGLVFKTIGRRTFYVLDPHAKLAVFLPLPWEDAA